MSAQPRLGRAALLALVTSGPSPYLLVADTLAGIRKLLPPSLVRSERQPADPPEVMEIWFTE